VDERDGKLLYRKLRRARDKAAAVVVADAVDDEPYVSSKIAPLLRLREEAMGGLALCRRASGAESVYIMSYKIITGLESKVPKAIDGVQVVQLWGGYPSQAHADKIKTPGRKLTVGIGALIHLYRAVYQAKPQSTVFVTVAGNCVAHPMNLEVSIGMTVMQILERCGYSPEPTRVVCGGPMTGTAVSDAENTWATHTTRAVLAFRESKRDALYSCIGCGRCEQVCPSGLNPMYIHRFVENSYYANLRYFDAHLCTGCGTCSYICPSKLAVSVSAQKAKKYAISHFAVGDGEVDEGEA